MREGEIILPVEATYDHQPLLITNVDFHSLKGDDGYATWSDGRDHGDYTYYLTIPEAELGTDHYMTAFAVTPSMHSTGGPISSSMGTTESVTAYYMDQNLSGIDESMIVQPKVKIQPTTMTPIYLSSMKYDEADVQIGRLSIAKQNSQYFDSNGSYGYKGYQTIDTLFVPAGDYDMLLYGKKNNDARHFVELKSFSTNQLFDTKIDTNNMVNVDFNYSDTLGRTIHLAAAPWASKNRLNLHMWRQANPASFTMTKSMYIHSLKTQMSKENADYTMRTNAHIQHLENEMLIGDKTFTVKDSGKGIIRTVQVKDNQHLSPQGMLMTSDGNSFMAGRPIQIHLFMVDNTDTNNLNVLQSVDRWHTDTGSNNVYPSIEIKRISDGVVVYTESKMDYFYHGGGKSWVPDAVGTYQITYTLRNYHHASQMLPWAKLDEAAITQDPVFTKMIEVIEPKEPKEMKALFYKPDNLTTSIGSTENVVAVYPGENVVVKLVDKITDTPIIGAYDGDQRFHTDHEGYVLRNEDSTRHLFGGGFKQYTFFTPATGTTTTEVSYKPLHMTVVERSEDQAVFKIVGIDKDSHQLKDINVKVLDSKGKECLSGYGKEYATVMVKAVPKSAYTIVLTKEARDGEPGYYMSQVVTAAPGEVTEIEVSSASTRVLSFATDSSIHALSVGIVKQGMDIDHVPQIFNAHSDDQIKNTKIYAEPGIYEVIYAAVNATTVIGKKSTITVSSTQETTTLDIDTNTTASDMITLSTSVGQLFKGLQHKGTYGTMEVYFPEKATMAIPKDTFSNMYIANSSDDHKYIFKKSIPSIVSEISSSLHDLTLSLNEKITEKIQLYRYHNHGELIIKNGSGDILVGIEKGYDGWYKQVLEEEIYSISLKRGADVLINNRPTSRYFGLEAYEGAGTYTITAAAKIPCLGTMIYSNSSTVEVIDKVDILTSHPVVVKGQSTKVTVSLADPTVVGKINVELLYGGQSYFITSTTGVTIDVNSIDLKGIEIPMMINGKEFYRLGIMVCPEDHVLVKAEGLPENTRFMIQGREYKGNSVFAVQKGVPNQGALVFEETNNRYYGRVTIGTDGWNPISGSVISFTDQINTIKSTSKQVAPAVNVTNDTFDGYAVTVIEAGTGQPVTSLYSSYRDAQINLHMVPGSYTFFTYVEHNGTAVEPASKRYYQKSTVSVTGTATTKQTLQINVNPTELKKLTFKAETGSKDRLARVIIRNVDGRMHKVASSSWSDVMEVYLHSGQYGIEELWYKTSAGGMYIRPNTVVDLITNDGEYIYGGKLNIRITTPFTPYVGEPQTILFDIVNSSNTIVESPEVYMGGAVLGWVEGLIAPTYYKGQKEPMIWIPDAVGTYTITALKGLGMLGNHQISKTITVTTRPTTPTTILAAGSLGIAGDSKITGLIPGTKYQVKVDNAVKYVRANGTLSDHETEIAALMGTKITGLTNGSTYKVETYIPTPTTPTTNTLTTNTPTNTIPTNNTPQPVITQVTTQTMEMNQQITNLLTDTTTTQTQKAQIIQDAVASMATSITKVKSEQEGIQTLQAVNQALTNVSTLMQTMQTQQQKEQIVASVANAVSNTRYALNAIEDKTKAIELAKDVMKDAGIILKQIEDTSTAAVDLRRAITEVGQKATDKAGNVKLEKAAIQVQKELLIATIRADMMKKQMEEAKKAAEEIKKQLAEAAGKAAAEAMNASITVQIQKLEEQKRQEEIRKMQVELAKSIMTQAKSIMTQAKENGFKQMTVQMETIGFTMDQDTLNNVGNDQNITLSAEELTTEIQSTEMSQDTQLLDKGKVYEFNATVGDSALEYFEEPIKVTIQIPAEERDTITEEEAESLIVSMLDETTNTWIAVGGIYDPITGSITAPRPHFSKYTVMKSNKSFSDVNNSWAKKEINVMLRKGIIDDVGQFLPSKSTTREEFTAWLVRIYGLEGSRSKLPFTDITKSNKYYNDIAIAYEKGLIKGKTDKLFDPKGTMSRQEIATVLTRAMEKYNQVNPPKNVDDQLKRFNDQDSIAKWAKEGVATAIMQKLVGGYPNGTYKPLNNAKRDEAAVLVYRLFNMK